MRVQRLLLAAGFALALGACFDFEGALQDCRDRGDCRETEAPPLAAPKVVKVEPENRATSVDPDTFVAVEFDRPMREDSVKAELEPSVLLVTPQWEDGGVRVSFTPSATLAFSTQYNVFVEGTSLERGKLNRVGVGGFTTKDAPPPPVGPQLVSSRPALSATNVVLDAGLTLSFSAPVDSATFFALFQPPVALGTAEWNDTGEEVTYPSAAPYTEGETYSLTFGGKGINGIDIRDPRTLTFQTVGDQTPPVVESTTPPNGQVNVSPSATPSITFNEKMQAVTTGAISVSPDAGCNWTLNSEGRIATCGHTVPLRGDAGFTITVSTGARDFAGNQLGAPFQFGFVTGSVPDTTPPTVVSTNPLTAARGIRPDALISVTFSEPMDPAATQSAIAITAPSGRTPTGFTWNPAKTVLSFTVNPPPPADTQVDWQISATARDLANNQLGTSQLRNYRTWRLLSVTLPTDPRDGYVYKPNSGTATPYPQYDPAIVGVVPAGRYRAFFSFDLTPLRATNPLQVESATLTVYESTTGSGNPYATPKGPVVVDVVELGSGLTAASFDLPNDKTPPPPYFCLRQPGDTVPCYTVALTNQYVTAAAHKATIPAGWMAEEYGEWSGVSTSTQRYVTLRVYAAGDASSTTTSDYVRYGTAENATPTKRASLQVFYYAP